MPIMMNYTAKHPGFAVMMTAADEAELTLYGEIVERQPRDWWTDEPLEGNWIVQDEVLSELDKVVQAGAKSIRLRINSLGGDAGVAITIHNRLRELAAEKGINVRCIIDGIAASGGSLIACACDEVEVFPASLFMIHKCLGMAFGWYNADELRERARRQDAWDQAQINIYSRKSGLSETVLSHMMSDTTYLTGRAIVDRGFADVLTEDGGTAQIAASASGNCLIVNGIRMHLAPGTVLPEGIPVEADTQSQRAALTGAPGRDVGGDAASIMRGVGTPPPTEQGGGCAASLTAVGRRATELGAPSCDDDQIQISTAGNAEDINTNQPGKTGTEGGNQTMATNLAELREENPELAAQVEADVRAGLPAETDVNAAVEAERNRLREIDAIAGLYGDEAVKAAKYGEHLLTAAELAFEQAKAAAQHGTAFAAAMCEDAEDANKVPAAGAKPDDDGEQDPKAAAKADFQWYKNVKEGKK